MFNNPVPVLDKLDELRNSGRDQDITRLYMKVFQGPDAEMVLVDLMDECHEFKPVTNQFEAGKQAVLIYIKNRLLGIAEPPHQSPTGDQNESSS